MAQGKEINLTDVQIVNGLQTSETIFQHFDHGESTSADRAVLVKVIVSSDALVRDRIIRATNNQNIVETASLRATDKIQRDIEDVLERRDWYYERRKNYFRYKGKPPSRFVTPMYLASAFVGLVTKDPARAAKMRSRFMRDDSGYRAIFSDKVPIELWPVLVEVMKRVEEGLATVRPQFGRGERFTARWRHLVALLCVSRLLGKFSYGRTDLLSLDTAGVTPTLVAEVWQVIESLLGDPVTRKRAFFKATFIDACCSAVSKLFGVAVPQAVRPRKPRPPEFRRVNAVPSKDIVAAVNAALPPQPWKVGMHIQVASQLGHSPDVVSAAIQELIRDGTRNRQKDGVVYDRDGRVIARDPERDETGDLP